MQFTDEVDWGVFDFVFAGVLLGGTGLLLELAARKPRNLAYRAAAAAIGVAAIVLGEADDAPGLVLFGGLLIVGTVALRSGPPSAASSARDVRRQGFGVASLGLLCLMLAERKRRKLGGGRNGSRSTGAAA